MSLCAQTVCKAGLSFVLRGSAVPTSSSYSTFWSLLLRVRYISRAVGRVFPAATKVPCTYRNEKGDTSRCENRATDGFWGGRTCFLAATKLAGEEHNTKDDHSKGTSRGSTADAGGRLFKKHGCSWLQSGSMGRVLFSSFAFSPADRPGWTWVSRIVLRFDLLRLSVTRDGCFCGRTPDGPRSLRFPIPLRFPSLPSPPLPCSFLLLPLPSPSPLPFPVAATFRPKGLFVGIYTFKFYTNTEYLNCHVLLCDLEK